MNELDRYAVSLENMEVLRAQVAELEASVVLITELQSAVQRENDVLKAQPSAVVLPERRQRDWMQPGVDSYSDGWNACLDEVARLNSSPASAGDSALREAVTPHVVEWVRCGLAANNRLVDGDHPALQKLRAALSANHSEQVLEGWQLVPVEPIDAMLEAGDKYIGTPATYKAMLSACPSPAITKDFSQFLSAVMDAAGLIRHGRQSKELSEYLGMKCMEYRAAPSAGSQEQGE